MSAERQLRDQLRAMEPQQFLASYLLIKEEQWAGMPRGILRAWNDELVFKGLVTQAEDAIGEMKTPSARWLERLLSQEAFPEQWAALEAREAASSTESTSTDTSPSSSEEASETGSAPSTGNPLPLASTASGGSSLAAEGALVVGPGRVTALPSIGVNSGAPRDVESGYEIVAYRRLPLAGKRDAFIAEGFLYVRNKTLRQWFEHLCLGKCCPAQQDGASHHSTGCWLDAVR